MNHLTKETSPYLLQHAHNPVEWYAWKPEAFERAQKEDKPILVSIGYSTCHWCHVMERESFENETVAAFMNKYFINIKVDREERPDVDQIYMEACQLVSGSGGWPLNCFLTPDGRPFYAATYFPPEPKYNRPSWIQVLQNISNAFYQKRQTIEDQANRLMNAINKSDDKLLNLKVGKIEGEQFFDDQFFEDAYYKIRERFDRLEGGFGGAPKFPGTMSLNFLLQYHFKTKNREALEHALFSLDKMIQGGIYDQLGGGFARYATDRAWLIPHFEKMLYDNALLVDLLADAYKLTQKELYAETIKETLDYVEREMTSNEGGFYAAQDADSEGVEGKFYIWDKSEVDEILGSESELFCTFYDVTEIGNWESKNILRRQLNFEDFAAQKEMDVTELKNKLKALREKLFEERHNRIYPGLDDKILLDWNALMCSAYANAYAALGIESYKEVAIKNLAFLLDKFSQEGSIALYHTYKEGQPQYDAFLNDYAYLIKALLDVYSITFNSDYLVKAQHYIDFVNDYFYDQENGLYFFTSAEQSDIITRKKEIFDSALPSGNAVMVQNLFRAGILLGQEENRETAVRMISTMKGAILAYPNSFGQWISGALQIYMSVPEVAVIGDEALSLAKQINKIYLPGKIIMASEAEEDNFELLKGRYQDGETLIYLCRNYTCQRPVSKLEDFIALL